MLHLVTFGGLALESVNAAVAPRLSAQRLAILAVLAAEGDRRVSRERLTGLFWPETDEERGRHSLRQALYALRNDLGREVVRSDFALSLDPSAIGSDVGEFRAALARGDRAAAGSLLRGPFLAGFYVPSAPSFQRWVEEERARLHTAAAAAMASLATEATAANDLDAAAMWWRQLTGLDALSGRFALGYLKALAARGDRAEALDFARQHTAVVRRELDTEPDPEIQRLEARLRSTSVSVSQSSPSNAGHSAPGSTATSTGDGLGDDGGAPEPAPTRQRRARSRLTGRAFAFGVVPALGIAVLMVALRSSDEARASDAPPTLAVGVIRDDGLDSVRLGPVLTDMLSTNLAGIPGLRVVANSRVQELIPRGEDSSAAAYADAARRAGASELLEGRLLDRAGDTFRIELRRVDLRSGLLKGAYRASASTRFRLVDSVTAIVARDLQLTAPRAPAADVTTRSATAYRLFQEGLRAYYRLDFTFAQQMMRAALEDDSTFAMAAYYDALVTDSPGSSAPSERALRLAARSTERERLLITVDLHSYRLLSPQALPAADTLSARYPDDARALAAVARARHLAGDWASAAHALERAIVLDSLALGPSTPCYLCADFAALTDVYFWSDSLSAAVRTARRYTALRPEWPPAWELMAWAAARVGDTATAYQALRKGTSLNRGPRFVPGEVRIRLLLDQYDRIEQDLRVLLESPRREDFLEARWWLLIALRNEGRLRDARRLMATGTLPGLGPPQAENVSDEVNEGLLALERGDPITARATYVAMWKRPLTAGLAAGVAARYHTWFGTLAGMTMGATGDTAAVLRMADSVQYWGARSLFGRDRRAHHYLRGLVHSAAGRDDAAITEFREAIHSPTLGFTRVNYELGRALLRRNRPREAAAAIAPALRGEIDAANLYITRTELHELLAQAHDQAGERDSAAVHYRAVVRAWAKADPAFHERRERARAGLAANDVRQ